MQTPLNIIIAAPGKGTGMGGVVRQMQYLAGEASKHPDKVTIHWLCTHSNNKLWPIYFIGTILHLIWLALTTKPDGIHLNIASKGSFYRKWTLFRIARFFSIPHIAHLHGGGFQDFYQKGSAATQRRITDLFTSASSVIVLGKKWKAFAQDELGVPETVTHTIFNAVPTPAEPSKGGGETPHLIFVGHLVPRKGVGELIEALAGLQELNWRATLAGSGELARYQEQVASAELTGRITFPGWLGDHALNQLYQSADILVLPSHIENQPLCVLEAMAHGLAIVTTDVGTVNEIVNEKSAIVIKSSYSAQDLKRAIQELITNSSKQKAIADHAHKLHFKKHSLKHYFDEFYTHYIQLKK